MEKFQDIIYMRPDFDKVKKELNLLINNFAKAKTFEQADEIYLKAMGMVENLETVSTVASIRHDMNVADKFYEGEVEYFNSAFAKLGILLNKFTKLRLKSPFKADFIAKYGEIVYKQAEVEKKLFNIFNVPGMIKEGKLSMQYSKLAATAKTEFDGKECNFYGLLKYMESPDRQVRRNAYLAWANLYESIAPQIDEIYGKLIKLRAKSARRAGYKSYIDYIYLSRGRYDYTAQDVAKYRAQVKQVVTPICAKLVEEQRQRIGVDKIRFYDERLSYPNGNADPIGRKDELVEKTHQMYADLSAETKEFFDFMVEHDLFDLETRPNKHMGGYCTIMPDYKAPFIFSNFNGTAADIQVLTHEAGHCFNMYLSMRANPTLETVSSTSEINEIHSMSMELFSFPYWNSYFGDQADKARYCHLMESLFMVAYICVVDEFQHKVFENPKMTPTEWRTTWRNIEKEYMPWRDYDGNEFLEKGGFWMQKQHILLYPFYYIDYALAQICAFQFYGRAKKDRADAWQDYVKLCRAGGTLGYFDLLKLANLNCPFDDGVVEQSVNCILDDIAVAPKE